MMYSIEEMENIRKEIEDTFRKNKVSAQVTLENFGKCIRIINNNQDNIKEDLNIWIRFIIDNQTDNKYIADVSSAIIPQSLRRKGIFTSFYNTLKSSNHISKVKITSVITEEMKNWCIKNNLKNTDMDWE